MRPNNCVSTLGALTDNQWRFHTNGSWMIEWHWLFFQGVKQTCNNFCLISLKTYTEKIKNLEVLQWNHLVLSALILF